MALSHNDLNTLNRIFGKAEGHDWKVISSLARKVQSDAQAKAAMAIRAAVGDKVEWTSNKTGKTLSGIISKINRKTIVVDTEFHGSWKVSPTMLRKVS